MYIVNLYVQGIEVLVKRGFYDVKVAFKHT